LGREAQCRCRWDGGEGFVKAHLEALELVIRGDLKRRFVLTDLGDVAVVADELRFHAGGEQFGLELGAAVAARWAKAIAAPPPSLSKKLGIEPGKKLYAIGTLDDDELIRAVGDAATATPEEATFALARIDDEAGLVHAVAEHARLADPKGFLWLVYRKGRTSSFGDTAVRAAMLARGFVDTKVAGVSPLLTATRFSRRRAD